MPKFVSDLYLALLGRNWAYRINRQLFMLSLKGMGILNYESAKVSGEADFIDRHVRGLPNGVVFDVGANVGDYTSAIRAANPNLEIFAFEPHPATFTKLMRNTASLGVKAMQFGVGEDPGRMKLYDYANNDGSAHASLYRDVFDQLHKAPTTSHDVEMIALDDFCERNGIAQIRLLKVDAEGHEMKVLKGLRRLIEAGKVDMIHFEFNEMNLASRVYFKDFWDFLGAYELYRMLPHGLLRLTHYQPLLCEVFAYQNIVAMRK